MGTRLGLLNFREIIFSIVWIHHLSIKKLLGKGGIEDGTSSRLKDSLIEPVAGNMYVMGRDIWHL